MKKLISLISLVAIIFTSFPAVASSDISACKLPISKKQYVALGFPISNDRLKSGISNIIVAPFKLTDTDQFALSSAQKNDFIQASELISKISGNRAKVTFQFLTTIDSGTSTEDLINLLKVRNLGWAQRDESKSTWGLARKLFAIADKQNDLSTADSIIFVGSSVASSTHIAEALQFDIKDVNGFFRPLEGDNRKILNAVLLDKHQQASVIAHEIMHNFGLTDLYGSNVSNSGLSLMDGLSPTLLNYEKWVLGWLPDSQVQCFDHSLGSENLNIMEIDLNREQESNLVIIKTSVDSAFMIESSRSELQGVQLAFYSFRMELRPPIAFYPLPILSASFVSFPSINDYSAIGTELISPAYSVLIKSINVQRATVALIPTALTNSEKAKDYRLQARENLRAETESADEARKAEQEANDGTAAEEKTKQDVAAQIAAQERARLESELRARAEEELKAKEALAAREKSTIEFKKSAVKKQISIICVKGKLQKKITAVKPKCPVGYKRK